VNDAPPRSCYANRDVKQRVRPIGAGGVRVEDVSPATVRRLLRARDLVHDRYDAPLRLDDLAGAAGLSRFFFLRAFTATFGDTPHGYLTGVRLDRAKRELARGSSVTEACLSAGFSSLGSFSALFSREFGASPREWQKRSRLVVRVPESWPAIFIPGCFLFFHTEQFSRST